MNPSSDSRPELKEIRRLLERIHRGWLWRAATRRLLTAAGLAGFGFWMLAGAEWAFGLPVGVRLALAAVAGLLALAALAAFARAFLGPVPYRRRAMDLEQFAPQLREQLMTAVDLADPAKLNRLGYAHWLYGHSIAVARRRLADLDLRRFWSRARLARGLAWGATGIACSLALGFVFPGQAGRTLFALTHPGASMPRPAPFDWSVTPLDGPVMQYEDVVLSAAARGPRPPQSAELQWRYADGEWFAEKLVAQAGNAEARFEHRLSAVPQSIRYRFLAEGRVSAEHDLTVARRPEVTDLSALCAPPRYTGIREFVLSGAEQKWIVPQNSEIRLAVESDRELSSGQLAFDEGSVAPLDVAGRRGEVSWRAEAPQTVRVFVTDADGLSNHDPVPIRIDVIPDLPPQIAMIVPGQDRDIPDAMVVPMAVALLDDYGFSRLELLYRIAGQDGERPEQMRTLPLPDGFGKEGVFEFNFSLLDARLFPGDRVSYRARVWDNDQPRPKWSESETYVLRLPTLDEMIAEAESRQEARTDQVAEAVRQQRKLAEELRRMAQELVAKDQVEWENRQEVEAAVATQEQLARQFQDWADQIEKEAEQLADHRLTSLAMLQKMNEISRLLREVMTPELEKALQRLREAMEALSPEEMRQALEDFQMSEEEILAELDRALAQLRSMQLEQMMENLLRLAERLAENQERQNRATESAAGQRTFDSLARAEQGLLEELADFKQKAQELAQKNQAFGGPPQIEQFARTATDTDAGGEMEAMTSQLQSGQRQQAGASGQRAAKALREMLARMQQQMLGLQSQMSAEQMARLRSLAERSLDLSGEQEAVGDSTAEISRQSLALRDLAAHQLALTSGIEELMKDVGEEAKRNLFLKPEVRRALRESQSQSADAVGALLERNGVGSQGYQYEAMFSLNQAAKGLMESLDNQSQCQGQGPGMGKMHSGMQDLAQQQQELNQQSQGMRNPFGLSPGEQEAVKRLSAQQQAIQRQMEELGSEYVQSRDRLGRLEEIAKSMDEVITDLSAGDLTETTLERQRNIYNRMLDFQKSLQRQDYENRRQSRSAQDLAGRAPEALAPGTPVDETEAARWERFRNEWYPATFRALVKDYFETVSQRRTFEPE